MQIDEVYAELRSSGWTRDRITRVGAERQPRHPGRYFVYFLFDSEYRLMYVGLSSIIGSRLYRHQHHWDRSDHPYSHALLLDIQGVRTGREYQIEQELIRQFNPPLNQRRQPCSV